MQKTINAKNNAKNKMKAKKISKFIFFLVLIFLFIISLQISFADSFAEQMTEKDKWSAECALLDGEVATAPYCNSFCEGQGKKCEILLIVDKTAGVPRIQPGTANGVCFACVDVVNKKSGDDVIGKDGGDGLGKDEPTDTDRNPNVPVEKSKPAKQPEEDLELICPTRPSKTYVYVLDYFKNDHFFNSTAINRGWSKTESAMGGGDNSADIINTPFSAEKFNKEWDEAIKNNPNNINAVWQKASRDASAGYMASLINFFQKESRARDIQCRDKVLVALEAHGIAKYCDVRYTLPDDSKWIIKEYLGDPFDPVMNVNGRGIPRDAKVTEKTHCGWFFAVSVPGAKSDILIDGFVLDPILRAINSCHITFVTDACYSGSIKYHQMIKRPGVDVFMAADAFHVGVGINGIPLYSQGFQKQIAKDKSINQEQAHESAKQNAKEEADRRNDIWKLTITNQNPQSYKTKRKCDCPCKNITETFIDVRNETAGRSNVTENITTACKADTFAKDLCAKKCLGANNKCIQTQDKNCYICEQNPLIENLTIANNTKENFTTNNTKQVCPQGLFAKSDCGKICTGTTNKCIQDKSGCYYCEQNPVTAPQTPAISPSCPHGTYDSCPTSGCDYCDATTINGRTCFSCQTYSCGENSWKSESECKSKCPSYYSSCSVSAQQGSAVCYSCSQLDCAAWCSSQSIQIYGEGSWKDYIMNYLNQNGVCKESATIQFSTVSLSSCTCAKEPAITIDQTPASCKGTRCGDVACGSSASCSCGENCQVTVNCKWGGWTYQGANTYVPTIGTVSG